MVEASSKIMKMDSESFPKISLNRPVQAEPEADVIPTPRNKFVNTMRGSCFSEISFDDLPLDFSQVNDNYSEPHECKLEDQRDKEGSKVVGEVLVLSVETNYTNDVSRVTTRSGEASCHQRSRFDMGRYDELKNSEQLLFEKWREQKLINSGGLLLCRNVLEL